MPEIPILRWLTQFGRKLKSPETESLKLPPPVLKMREIGQLPTAYERAFPRYQHFHDADTLGLYLRAKPPEGPITISLANATYSKGVNVDPSQWLARNYIGSTQPGLVIEVDPELKHASEAPKITGHTGFTQWAANLENVTPIMVSARSDEVLPYLHDRADAVVVVSPSPEYMNNIIRDGYQLLKSGGELTVVLDPITTETDEGQHAIKPDLIAKLQELTPGAESIVVNGSPYTHEKPPTYLSVKEYEDMKLPRTRYISDADDYDAPVLVYQVKKPLS